MAAKNATTWVNYFDELRKRKFNPERLEVQGIEKLINLNQYAFNMLGHSVPMIYILDYTRGEYAFVSNPEYSLKKIIGWGD
jgi:hypothetical protein